MFKTTELMFRTIELKFKTIEHKFRTYEHNFFLGLPTIASSNKNFFLYSCSLFYPTLFGGVPRNVYLCNLQ